MIKYIKPGELLITDRLRVKSIRLITDQDAEP